jgi:flagellar motor component MotA
VVYRRWALLTLICVAASFVLLLAGVILANFKPANLSVLSAVTSLVTGTVGALLYKRLGSAQSALMGLRKELFMQLEKRQGMAASST